MDHLTYKKTSCVRAIHLLLPLIFFPGHERGQKDGKKQWAQPGFEPGACHIRRL
jgi:hypothetical protein